MFKTLEFQSQNDVDIAIFAGNITRWSFQLRYRLGGPALVKRIKVHWIAVNDENVIIENHELGFMDLIKTKTGSGERIDEFDFNSVEQLPSNPKILIFITGFKINHEHHPYSLITDGYVVDQDTYRLIVKTACSILRYATVSILIATEESFIMENSQVDVESFSYFEIENPDSRGGIGGQRYSTPVPREYFTSRGHTIISAGISGFQVDSEDQNCFSVSLDQLYLRDSRFYLRYGPTVSDEECRVYQLNFNVIIHLPSLPDEINEQRVEEQHQLMHQYRQVNHIDRDEEQ